MVSQQVRTNLQHWVKIPKALKQVNNTIIKIHKKQIATVYLTEISGTREQPICAPRQTRFNEQHNQQYSPYHFAPSPALSTGSDMLSRSIMQLAETQSCSREILQLNKSLS